MVRSEHAMAHRLLRLVPNSMSLGSLVVGVMSIVLMETQDFLLAGMLIWIGSALDVLDGGLAGRLNVRTAFGKQLDNLADVVTFGIAPALLAYHLLALGGAPLPLAAAATLVWAVCGASRLARFAASAPKRPGWFEGIPIPAAALFIVSAGFWQQWNMAWGWALVLMLVAFLMVSPFGYPKHSTLRQVPAAAWLLQAVILAACGFFLGWQALPFCLALMYAASGPLLLLMGATARRRLLRMVG